MGLQTSLMGPKMGLQAILMGPKMGLPICLLDPALQKGETSSEMSVLLKCEIKTGGEKKRKEERKEKRGVLSRFSDPLAISAKPDRLYHFLAFCSELSDHFFFGPWSIERREGSNDDVLLHHHLRRAQLHRLPLPPRIRCPPPCSFFQRSRFFSRFLGFLDFLWFSISWQLIHYGYYTRIQNPSLYHTLFQ